ncbi:Hypothetical predicted protein [Olea europaea subsp. europaea]|uniref:Uncharacterized protein n=1 Tax=Olea europaea subsp. europaea TaxID=158383 RepID=A0A8S0S754_OLEEU|nr:Hypothetical predicted protein [Olea europaea subsp. europaea]
MATTTLKLTTLLSLTLSLLLTLHSPTSFSFASEDDDEEYLLDTPIENTRLRSRFLANIKKGTRCDAAKNNVCNGISASKGEGLLFCCKKHCRNVLSDKNNCGICGHKCKLGERCCHGTCTNVFYNPTNCGKCDKMCSSGVKCQYGYCGYA